MRPFYIKYLGGDLSLDPETPPVVANNWGSFNPAEFSLNGTTFALTATSNALVAANINSGIVNGYAEMVIPTITSNFFFNFTCDAYAQKYKPNGDIVSGGSTSHFFGAEYVAGDTIRFTITGNGGIIYRNGSYVADFLKHPPVMGGDAGGAASSIQLQAAFSGMTGIIMQNPVLG